MDRVPLRGDGAVLGVAEYVTVPLPLPLPPDWMVSQVSLLVAVQGSVHPLNGITFTDDEPPLAVKVMLVDDRV